MRVCPSIFPTRQSFATACVMAFGGNNVLYLVCSKEEHDNGGSHYHVTLTLKRSQRWFHAKEYLKDNHGVIVNFSTSPNGGMYAGAYHYAIKSDKNPYHLGVLEKHPDLSAIGANVGAANANAAYRKRRSEAAAEKDKENIKKKEKSASARRMDKLDVIDFFCRKEIRTCDELLAASEIRREAGDRELARFVMNLGEKGRNDIITDAWKMHHAIRNVIVRNKTSLQITSEFVSKRDNCKCNGLWLTLAVDVLIKNNIDPYMY